MTLAPNQFIVHTDQLNQRVDNFLLTRLKGLPKSCLYRLLRQGKIRINQKRKKPEYRLQINDVVKVPLLNLNTTTSPTPTKSLEKLLKASILLENPYFLVVNKPRGLAVHGGSGLNFGLIESLRQLYPAASLELVHRLDRDTSGCLLVSKKSSTLKCLHALFREGKIRKSYMMLTKGQWPKQLQTVEVALKKNQLTSGERLVKVDVLGKPCRTSFKLHKHYGDTSLVEAILHTGRTHQIRVHAQHVNHPILGDEKYGDKNLNRTLHQQGLKHMFLHAFQLQFDFPLTHEAFRIEAPLPEMFQKVEYLNNCENTEGGT